MAKILVAVKITWQPAGFYGDDYKAVNLYVDVQYQNEAGRIFVVKKDYFPNPQYIFTELASSIDDIASYFNVEQVVAQIRNDFGVDVGTIVIAAFDNLNEKIGTLQGAFLRPARALLEEFKVIVDKIIKSYLTVPKGQLTFDAEGNDINGSIFYSRVAHLPPGRSGVTIGRGYDLRERKKDDVVKDLMQAGLAEKDAKAFAEGVGLSGEATKKFIATTPLVEITLQQQNKLFVLTYNVLEADVIRICQKPNVVSEYGATNWQNLNPRICDVVVDLRYRGDYTGADDPRGNSRKLIQKHIANNDLTAFTLNLSDEAFWVNKMGVPKTRFNERLAYLRAPSLRSVLPTSNNASLSNFWRSEAKVSVDSSAIFLEDSLSYSSVHATSSSLSSSFNQLKDWKKPEEEQKSTSSTSSLRIATSQRPSQVTSHMFNKNKREQPKGPTITMSQYRARTGLDVVVSSNFGRVIDDELDVDDHTTTVGVTSTK